MMNSKRVRCGGRVGAAVGARAGALAGAALLLALCGSAGAQVLDLQQVATGFSNPVLVTHAPGDFANIFVVEQRSGSVGRIRVVNLATGAVQATPFLSISPVSTGSEQGLLGLTFDPAYDSNGFFYVNYTDSAGTTRIVRYTRSASNPLLADASSATPVLSIAQPFSNHNGGWMGFGPDGYLYISVGDGGSGGDPGNRAQDITGQLLGKMLRIDPSGDDFPADASRNYAVPPTNPFVGVTGDDEIWAYGLRNAWRCDIDPQTGDIWYADVGQNVIEEVNFEAGGASGGGVGGLNYGWRCYEGNNTFNTGGCPPAANLEFPIHTYTHGGEPFRCSITGGVVYRGAAMPELRGTYFFADYCANRVWSLRYDGAAVTDFTERTADLGSFGSNATSFGRDAFGEMYIISQGGTISRIVPQGGNADCNDNGLPDLSETAFGLTPDFDGGPLGDPAQGAAYFAANCASCHAADGTGQFGPNIRNKTRTEIGAFISTTAHPGGQFNLGPALLAHVESFLSDTGSRARPDGVPDSCQTLADCDSDGVSDGQELGLGTQRDLNFNGVPDDCEACAADFNGDTAPGDIFDLFDFLAALDGGLDYNGDTVPADIFDLFDFLAVLDAGCP